MPGYTPTTFYDAPNPLTPLSAARINAELAAIAAAIGGGVTAMDAQPACRVFNSASISLTTSAALQTLTFDTNRFDSDSQHFTSAAALTGTVAKTAASAAIVGTGTLFTSQLSVGQVIDIPGTTTERRVVTSITNDTNLTVAVNLANTASGQTATRVNSAIVARTAGVYNMFANITFAANNTDRRQVMFLLNGTTAIGDLTVQSLTNGAAATRLNPSEHYKLAQWDYVEVQALQASGGALNISVEANRSPEFGMFRVAAG